MLGGSTYEEGRAVSLLNQRLANDREGGPGGTRILLGGSMVHNSARYARTLSLVPDQSHHLLVLILTNCFLDMVEASAEHFPNSIYAPPTGVGASASLSSTPAPSSSATPAPLGGTGGAGGIAAPAINLRAGGYELSVGGTGGSGLYRTQPGDVGASLNLDGLKDGAGRLWGNVRQWGEERVSRSGTPGA